MSLELAGMTLKLALNWRGTGAAIGGAASLALKGHSKLALHLRRLPQTGGDLAERAVSA